MKLPGNPICLIDDVANNRDEWLRLRQGKISATKIGVILGVNRYKSPLQLWAEETGKVTDYFTGNWSTKLGLLLEPFVAELLQDTLGTNRCYIKLANALYQHKELDWAIASPDAFVVFPDDLKLAELKTANYRNWKDWDDGAIPEAYELQLQWQMGVTGIQSGYLACMVGGNPNEFYYPFLEFDNEIWNIMLDAAVDFRDCVQRDVPPEPGPGDAKLIEKILSRYDSDRMLPEAELIEAETLIPMLLALRNKKKELQDAVDQESDEIKTIENKLRLILGASTAASAAGYRFEVQTVNVAERVSPAYAYTKLKLSKRKYN